MKTPKPGTVYVAIQPGRQSVKVGCMTVRSRRLERLRRYGWVLYRRLNVVSVDLAHEIEQAVLFDLRHRLLVPVHVTAEELPIGWTETASAALVSAPKMWDLVGEQAGLAYLAPVVRKVQGRRGPKIPATPPVRRKGDTAPYHPAAKVAAADTARKHAVVNGHHH